MDRCYYIGVHGCRVGRLPDTALSGTNKFMFFYHVATCHRLKPSSCHTRVFITPLNTHTAASL